MTNEDTLLTLGSTIWLSETTEDTLLMLERNIENLPIEDCGRPSRTVDRLPFPNMVAIYQSMATVTMPPTQYEFLDEVVEKMPTRFLRSVEARATRTYQSFVRQHHAQVALATRFWYVMWPESLDLEGNVDLIVIDVSPRSGRVAG